MSSSSLNPQLKNWLKKFSIEHGRPLRVLHIGNIAGNAYSNAKLQRRIGIDAYLIEDQDKHIMSQPEWEDADFEGDWGDDFQPNWNSVDLKGYKRPSWVISGDLMSCLFKIENIFLKNKKSINLPLIKHIIFSIVAFLFFVWVWVVFFCINIFYKIISNIFCMLKEISKIIIKHFVLIGIECSTIVCKFFATLVNVFVNSSPYFSYYVRKALSKYITNETLFKIYKFLMRAEIDWD